MLPLSIQPIQVLSYYASCEQSSPIIPKVLSAFDLPNLPEILNQENFPEKVDSIFLLSYQNEKWAFEINKTWILLVAKEQIFQDKVLSYESIFNELNGHLEIDIPALKWKSETFSMYAYPRIEGKILSRSMYEDSLKNSVIHQQIANFIKNLEEIDETTLNSFNLKTYRPESITYIRERIAKIPGDKCLIEKIEMSCDRLIKVMSKEYKSVLCHGDLHGRNLIIDEESQRCRGIIDFDDVLLAPRFVEFTKMHLLSTEFAIHVIEAYEKEPNKQQEYLRASIYDFLVRRTEYLLDAIEKGNKKLIDDHLSVLKEFVQRAHVQSILN